MNSAKDKKDFTKLQEKFKAAKSKEDEVNAKTKKKLSLVGTRKKKDEAKEKELGVKVKKLVQSMRKIRKRKNPASTKEGRKSKTKLLLGTRMQRFTESLCRRFLQRKFPLQRKQ